MISERGVTPPPPPTPQPILGPVVPPSARQHAYGAHMKRMPRRAEGFQRNPPGKAKAIGKSAHIGNSTLPGSQKAPVAPKFTPEVTFFTFGINGQIFPKFGMRAPFENIRKGKKKFQKKFEFSAMFLQFKKKYSIFKKS